LHQLRRAFLDPAKLDYPWFLDPSDDFDPLEIALFELEDEDPSAHPGDL
jgi:hypothetical protein